MASRWGSSVMTRGALLVAALAVVGCSSQPTPPTLPISSLHRAGRPSLGSPIAHVVFIIQENRSFNNLFMGYPGATTAKYGYDTNGKKIKLLPIGLKTEWDIDHSSNGVLCGLRRTTEQTSRHGLQDGRLEQRGRRIAPSAESRVCVRAAQRDRTLLDRWHSSTCSPINIFASNLDGSFVAHQYAVAAYASATVNGPEGRVGM